MAWSWTLSSSPRVSLGVPIHHKSSFLPHHEESISPSIILRWPLTQPLYFLCTITRLSLLVDMQNYVPLKENANVYSSKNHGQNYDGLVPCKINSSPWGKNLGTKPYFLDNFRLHNCLHDTEQIIMPHAKLWAQIGAVLLLTKAILRISDFYPTDLAFPKAMAYETEWEITS